VGLVAFCCSWTDPDSILNAPADTLSDQRVALQESLLSEVGLTSAEAEVELAETLTLVKRLVEESEFKKQMKKVERELREDGMFYRGKGVVVVCAEAAGELRLDRLSLSFRG